MSFKIIFTAGLAALTLPALVEAQMTIENAYARSSGPMAQSGAAFMTITNSGDADDRVTGVLSDAAERVELHTHIGDENGVMRMRPALDGFPVAAGATHMLQRGGDHVMFMGLAAPWRDGGEVIVTLLFEYAAPMVLRIPIDQVRPPISGSASD